MSVPIKAITLPDGTTHNLGVTILSGTLTAGETTLAISDENLSDSSIILGVYPNADGIKTPSISVSGHTLTLTFDAQTDDLSVRVVIV